MQTLADVVGNLDNPEQPAVRAGRVHDAREFRSQVYKTGNALRHLGVREDAQVAILDAASPQAVQTFFGATLLGATVEFGPDRVVDARVLAGPTVDLGDYDLPAGGQRLGWGDPPVDPSWTYFERDVWSENPTFPEPSVTADTGLLAGYSHADVVAAAETVATDFGESDAVAVRAPLSQPGTVIAGLVAPLLAGASVVLPPESGDETVAANEGCDGTVAVSDTDDVPEGRVLAPTDATP